MKNFCVIPWFSREIDMVSGKEQLCCWLTGEISRQDLQEKLLSGERPKHCKRCWDNEDNGVESRRQMENRFLDFKMDRDIDLLAADARQGSTQENMYQIFLGSVCNSTCVTCGPSVSSAWRSLENKSISIRQEKQHARQHFVEFCDSVNWTEAKRFNLLGGEPLLIDLSFDILQKLLDAGNTDCRVSFVTNGSVMLSESQIAILRCFSDISCCISIDGIGKSFDYIRYPLSWNNLLITLTQYRKIFTEVVVSFTISNLNYQERSKIIKWFQTEQLLYIENFVVNPPWFSVQVDPDHDLWPRFVEEITRQDKIKGIHIRDYLPDIADMIDQTCR